MTLGQEAENWIKKMSMLALKCMGTLKSSGLFKGHITRDQFHKSALLFQIFQPEFAINQSSIP